MTDNPKEEADDELGPEETSDDSTMADMGLGGTPADSATPIGQGEEPGTGAHEHDEEEGQED